MSDRLDLLVSLSPKGFSLWKTNDGAWQLNIRTEDLSFAVFIGRDLDDVLDDAVDGMRFRRQTPAEHRAFAATRPGTLKPSTSRRRNIL